MSGCSVNGCERPHKARGMCAAHAQRLRDGTPMDQPIRLRSVPLEMRYRVDSDGCWLWMGEIDAHGYGKWHHVMAYRGVYELLREPIPDGLQLDHLCRVPRCVNPDHLEPVTARENNRRSTSITALNGRKTHCLRGHEFNAENTYIRVDGGGRQCRKCVRIRKARYAS